MGTYETHFDGRYMRLVHAMLRREFGLLPGLVREAPEGDLDHAELLGDHIDLLVALLHHQQQAEEESVWPLLLERCPEQIVPLVTRMRAEQAAIVVSSQQVSSAMSVWRDTATGSAAAALARALDELVPELNAHLAVKGERVIPPMELHVTTGEWNRIMQKATTDLGPWDLPLAFGMLIYESEPGMIESVLEAIPAELRPALWQQAVLDFATHSGRIHGTATPPWSIDL